MPRVSRRSAVATLAIAGLGVACRTNSSGDLASALDDVAERYVRSALELAQHQPSLVEAWLGPEGWRPGARRPVAELRAELDQVARTLATFVPDHAPGERGVYLRQQLDALHVAARRLSGEPIGFVDEARAAFGSDAADMLERFGQGRAATDSPEVEAALAILAERLPGRGALYERYAAFRTRHALSSSQIATGLPAGLEAFRRRVHQLIQLPSLEKVELTAAAPAGFAARATYDGAYRSRIRIDTSRPIDLVHLLWLIAHEAYPGHHVQYVLADRDRVQTRHWQERALLPAFGRHLLCAEGAAEAAATLLLHVNAFHDVYRDVAPVIGISDREMIDIIAVHGAVRDLDALIPPIAQSYLDGDLGGDAAAEQLTTRALVLEPRPLLLAIERQRTRILAYPVGRRLVWRALNAVPSAHRWARLQHLATALIISDTAGEPGRT